MWKLFVGRGKIVEDITPADISLVAKALGALGDWKGIVRLLQSKSTVGGGGLNRVRWEKYFLGGLSTNVEKSCCIFFLSIFDRPSLQF